MERGEIYLIDSTGRDPRRRQPFVVVSRPEFVAARYSSVICVPLYSTGGGLPTEVPFDDRTGLKHVSFARCDELTSVPRYELKTRVGSLSARQMRSLSQAMARALAIEPEDIADL